MITEQGRIVAEVYDTFIFFIIIMIIILFFFLKLVKLRSVIHFKYYWT